jgi:hypothetical protein
MARVNIPVSDAALRGFFGSRSPAVVISRSSTTRSSHAPEGLGHELRLDER